MSEAPYLPSPDTSPVLHDFATTPDASVEDIGESTVSQLRKELDNNLLDFAWAIFGYKDLTVSYHGPICDYLLLWGKPGWRRLGIQVARETFKTSLCTRANALWQVARHPTHDPTVAIFNAKESNSKKWLKSIRNTVHSSYLLQVVYREMIPPGIAYWDTRSTPKRWRWSDIELDFERDDYSVPEASITGLGIGGAATGGHWTHIIKDDIIGLEESRSEAEMQRAREWIDTARYLERPAEFGNDIFVYTRWHYNDVYRYYREKWGDEYQVFHRLALEEDPATGEETSSFPEKWTTSQLQKLRERDPYYFASQMQSIPMAGRETAFDPDWNRYCSTSIDSHGDPFLSIDHDSYNPQLSMLDEGEPGFGESVPRTTPIWHCDLVLLWDPAPSEKSQKNQDGHAARNGKVALAIDPYGREYILEARGTRLDPVDEMKDTLRLAHKWGITKCAVEEVNFSKVYRHWANYMQEKDEEFKELPWVSLGRRLRLHQPRRSPPPHPRGNRAPPRPNPGPPRPLRHERGGAQAHLPTPHHPGDHALRV
jgi:hypothetical protein